MEVGAKADKINKEFANVLIGLILKEFCSLISLLVFCCGFIRALHLSESPISSLSGTLQ